MIRGNRKPDRARLAAAEAKRTRRRQRNIFQALTERMGREYAKQRAQALERQRRAK